MYQWWVHLDKANPPALSLDKFSQYFYATGCLGKLTEDIDGYEITEEGLTDETFAGLVRGEIRVWFPKHTDEDTTVTFDEQTGEAPETVAAFNFTEFDLKEDEEVKLVQLPGAWIITAPVRPTMARFALTADLTATGEEADGTVDWGTETIKIKTGDLATGKKFASGTKGWAQRLKSGYYIVSTFSCPT